MKSLLRHKKDKCQEMQVIYLFLFDHERKTTQSLHDTL